MGDQFSNSPGSNNLLQDLLRDQESSTLTEGSLFSGLEGKSLSRPQTSLRRDGLRSQPLPK